ncbi:MAG: alpha/beta fold hydrolase [Acidobacteriaceae bacterium]
MTIEIAEKQKVAAGPRRWLLVGGAIFVAVLVAFVGYGFLHPLRLANEAVNLRLDWAGIHSRYVTVDGYRIHYYEGGPAATTERPPVVLVHGLGGYAEQWADLMVQLVKAHRRVYAMDLLGYGKSARPMDASYSVPEEAGIVKGFLKAKGIGHYDLVGWSMGGWVATQVALDDGQPGHVRKLVLMDSAGLRYTPAWNTDLFVPDTPAKLKALDNLLFVKPPVLPGFVRRAVIREALREGWVVQRSMSSMLTGLDLEDGRLGQLQMPVLIVWGSDDRIIPLSVGERMHEEIPQSEMDVFEGCGHLGPVQCAGRIGPEMIGFLGEK